MTAAEHITFLDMILTQYALKLDDLVAIACDNMETNRAISKRIGVPMIGCAAHRFNLAVKDHVKDEREVINKVSVLMKKLRTVKRRAVLKKHGCKHRPVPLHELRWSGLHRMLKRYSQLHPFLHLFDRDRDVDRDLPESLEQVDPRRRSIVDFIPSALEHCVITDLLEDMRNLELATKTLQRADPTLADARDAFDEILLDFPHLSARLGSRAPIIESPDFESAVVKLQANRESDLTKGEQEALKRVHRTASEPTAASAAAARTRVSAGKKPAKKSTTKKSTTKKRAATVALPSPAQKRRRSPEQLKEALKQRALDRSAKKSQYVDLQWLPATSVMVERLFSNVKSTLGYLRKSMSAEMLEALLYLRLNWDLVTEEIISTAIRTAREDSDDTNDEESDAGGDAGSESDAESDGSSDDDGEESDMDTC